MNLKSFFILLISFLGVESLIAQNQAKEVIPSISELIFPAKPETKNNFNLFYEIHLERDSIPQPSFWYKIVFDKDCDFEFTLFPLMNEDRYDFYLYKVEGNAFFCDALEGQRVISLNHYKYIKSYTDNDQSEAFRSSLVHIKPIPIKAGDAVYLEVFAVKGRDCGHIFDCRTSESSLVTKVINDNCSAITAVDYDADTLLSTRKEETALHYLSDLFCLKRKGPIVFTSISLRGKNRTVKVQKDFLSYSKKEAEKYVAYQPKATSVDSSQAIMPALKESKAEAEDSSNFVKQVLAERRKKADSLALSSSKGIKSTADLNLLVSSTDHHTIYEANQTTKPTRLKVDQALFRLLFTDLKQKREAKKLEIRNAAASYKRLGKKNVSKKRQAYQALKALKKEKKAIEKEMAETQSKIKVIQRLIAKEDYVLQENFVFNKSVNSRKNELVYKVQIGVYKNKISNTIFNGLSPVSEDPYEGGVRYSVGAFPKFDYAKQAKEHVVEIGLKDAFIVAYFKGTRISIQEAMALEP